MSTELEPMAGVWDQIPDPAGSRGRVSVQGVKERSNRYVTEAESFFASAQPEKLANLT